MLSYLVVVAVLGLGLTHSSIDSVQLPTIGVVAVLILYILLVRLL